jgi:hypothetical protein
VNFVDNEDFEAGAVGQVTYVFPQLTNVIDAGIRGAVYFNDIKALSCSDFRAGRTASARLSFADTACAGKEKGMMNAARTDGVGG